MSLYTGLYSYLMTEVGITAVVVDRVYPGSAPENTTYPYISYMSVSQTREPHLNGISGVVAERIQFDIYSYSHVTNETLFQALRNSLDALTHTTMDNTNVRRVFLDDSNEEFISPSDSSDNGIYRKRIDFMFHHTEADPV